MNSTVVAAVPAVPMVRSSQVSRPSADVLFANAYRFALGLPPSTHTSTRALSSSRIECRNLALAIRSRLEQRGATPDAETEKISDLQIYRQRATQLQC